MIEVSGGVASGVETGLGERVVVSGLVVVAVLLEDDFKVFTS